MQDDAAAMPAAPMEEEEKKDEGTGEVAAE